MEVVVNRGTAFCESCRRPSKEPKKKVLSFLMGKPIALPNCWRLSEFLIGRFTRKGEVSSLVEIDAD